MSITKVKINTTGVFRKLFTVLLLTCPLSFAGAQDAVTLKFKYVQGEVTNYQTNGQISVPLGGLVPQTKTPGPQPTKPQHKLPQSFNLPINLTQKVSVKKIDKNGDAQVEVTTSGTSPMSQGMGGNPNSMSTSVLVATPLGVLKSAAGQPLTEGTQEALNGVAALGAITAYLPSHPVRPGDKWSMQVSVPKLQQKATVSGVYLKLEQVGRYKTARIQLIVTLPIHSNVNLGAVSKGQTSGSTTLTGKLVMQYEDNFAIQEGKLIKTAGSGVTTLTLSQPAGGPAAGKLPHKPITVKITMSSALIQ